MTRPALSPLWVLLFEIYVSSSACSLVILRDTHPLLAFREMCFKCLSLPVPVVLRRFAFSDHSYFLVFAAGYPQFEQVCF